MDQHIDPRIDIGHVHLKVADLERAVTFYSGVLGFQLTQRMGTSAAFLSVGGYHHYIGLNTWESLGGAPAPPGSTGLYHFAIRYPDRGSLGDALRRLREAHVPVDGASDHGVSEAIYLRDPDGNGIELYRDRPRDEWPTAGDGSLMMVSEPLDLRALLRDACQPRVPPTAGADGSLSIPLTDSHRQRLGDLRMKLLTLHKALLDDTRVAYELDRGAVGSNTNLLQLVINDPWFAWLHSVSELVVRIDETIGPSSPATDKEALELSEQVDKLLTASETGEGFHRRYFEALQRQPAVVLAHADVRRTLKAMKE
ncbi:MAG TPA: VOC family protein [Vicinamibacterales bacterium]|nr:VOC family protein [Vicinamibacterales bacterium]